MGPLGEAFAAEAEVVEGEWSALGQQEAEVGGVAAAGDVVAEDELVDFVGVAANVGWHDVDAAADGEDGVEVFDGGIEGDGGVATDAALGGEAEEMDDGVDEVEQGAVGDGDAFGGAGGAGGVDGVGDGGGGRERGMGGGGEIALHALSDVLLAGFGPVGIEGHVGCSDAHDGEGLDEEVGALAAVDDDVVAGTDALLGEALGMGKGALAQFAVGEGGGAVGHGEGLGGALGLLEEEADEGLGGVVGEVFALAQTEECLFFGRGEDGELGQGAVGVGHDAFGAGDDGLGDGVEALGGEEG